MNKIYLLLLLNFGIFQPIIAQELVPFQKNGKYGFRNKNTEVIPPRFDYACFFSNGLALVKSTNLWGYIDSTGHFRIPLQFDNAQPFIDNRAYVFKSGKMGLIQANGDYLIKPDYTKCVEGRNGFYTFMKDKKGFIYTNSQLEIPPIYNELKEASSFVSGKNDNSTWDIYMDGKLIIKNTRSAVDYSQINFSAKTVILSKNDRFGVYHFEKGWIIDPIYQTIETVPFFDYQTNDSETNYEIFALYKVKSEFNNASDITEGFAFQEDSIRFAKMNGEIITNDYYSSFSVLKETDPEGYGESVYSFRINKYGSVGFINRDFSLTQTKYNTLIEFLDVYIGQLDDKMYILSDRFEPIDSFKSVCIYTEILYTDINELGKDEVQEINIYEPFLVVSKTDTKEEQNYYAIYETNEKKIISPWIKSYPKVTRSLIYESNDLLYIYSDGSSKNGFYTRGMQSGTDIIYETVNHNGSNFMYAHTTDPDGSELFFIKDKNVKLILKEKSIVSSTFIKTLTINSEIGIEPSESPTFYNDFSYVKNAAGKYGLVSQNGIIIPCEYDSITQNTSYGGESYLVNVHKNNLIGYVNITTGDLIPPFSDQILMFEHNTSLDVTYARSGDQPEDFYITIEGEKFYTTNTEYTFFKKHGMYGASGYSDFNFDNPEIIIIPPVYKKIEHTYVGDRMFAMNKKKLYGMINSFGDTLAQFQYTRFELSFLDSDEGDQLYQVFHGKKQGLLSAYKGQLIPPIYEKIDYLFDYGFKIEGYLVQAYGKKGFYHPSGKLIVPCEYEVIECMNHNSDYFKTMLSRKAGKWYTWNYAQWEQNLNDSIHFSHGYDFIIESSGYIKNGEGYDVYDLFTNQLIISESSDNEYTTDLYTLFSDKNGKCGVKSVEGKILIQPVYDMIQFLSDNGDFVRASENGILYTIDLVNNIRNIEINDQY